MTKSKTIAYINNHTSSFPEEIEFIKRISDFVQKNDDFFLRSNLQGHITGSAWIISPDSCEVLLIHHNKLNRWFQPGGHVEQSDNSILDTAIREGKEETGISELELLEDGIFDIDIHTIPAKNNIPEHLHYDIRFIFQTNDKKFTLNSEETSGIKWVSLNSILTNSGFDQSMIRMAKKTALYNHNI